MGFFSKHMDHYMIVTDFSHLKSNEDQPISNGIKASITH